MKSSLRWFLLFSVASLCLAKGEKITTLPNLKSTLLKPLTASGFSSGGAMATQFHVAHSSLVESIGVFSSVFYRCGNGGHLKFSATCVQNKTEVSKSVQDAKGYEQAKKIDPLSNLNGSKIFVWSGEKDNTVPTAVSKKVTDFYKYFTAANNIRFVAQDASHEFPTQDYGAKCPINDGSYIGNCDFAGGFEMLSTILGSKMSIQMPPNNLKTQSPIYFDQSEFTAPNKPKDIGLDDKGYYYIPSKCKENVKCPLHIFFHGCSLGNQDYQPVFADRISYFKLAEWNNIVMLFPLAAPGTKATTNPMGCWDVYGERRDGKDLDNFATKDGIHIGAIKRMVDRLFGN